MKYLISIICLTLTMELIAQDLDNYPMLIKQDTQYKAAHSALYQLGNLAIQSAPQAKQRILSQKLLTRSDDKINIEIVYVEDLSVSIDQEFLEGLPIEVANTWKNRASCWIDAEKILEVYVIIS